MIHLYIIGNNEYQSLIWTRLKENNKVILQNIQIKFMDIIWNQFRHYTSFNSIKISLLSAIIIKIIFI